jgi:hypothetical protein
MTTHVVKGQVVFSCDDCPETYEPDEGDFGTAWALARGLGWRTRQRDGKWQHSCPDCSRRPQ